MSTASAIRRARAFKRAEYGMGDEQTWGPVVDPRDPRADDPPEDWLDDDAAEMQAADECMADGYILADALWRLADCDKPIGPATYEQLFGREWTPSEAHSLTLIAVLVSGGFENAALARVELNDRLRHSSAMKTAIEDRKRDLLAEQDRNVNMGDTQ